MEGQPTIALVSTTSIQQNIYEHIMCCNLLLIAYSKVDQVATHVVAHLSPTTLKTLIMFSYIQSSATSCHQFL